jgi:Cu+-exporting ATPase
MVDPVCGMRLDPMEASKAGPTAAHGERVFYFCSDRCKQQFVADPSRYAKRPVAKP